MANKICIQLGPIRFEADGDNEFIEKEREKFFSLLPETISAISPFVTDQRIKELIDDDDKDTDDLNEYPEATLESLLKEKAFKTDVGRVLCIAYYLDQIKAVSPFSSKDLESKYNEVCESKLSNINASINSNITKGFIIESKEKKYGLKTFYLTPKGIEWFFNFKPAHNTVKIRNAKEKQSSVLLDIPLEELNLYKYPDINSLNNFREQMFVIMMIYTAEKNIEYFSRNDLLSVINDKFSVPATKDQVAGVLWRFGSLFDSKEENKTVLYKMLSGAILEAQNIINEALLQNEIS